VTNDLAQHPQSLIEIYLFDFYKYLLGLSLKHKALPIQHGSAGLIFDRELISKR
jgi:hypothetical protein